MQSESRAADPPLDRSERPLADEPGRSLLQQDGARGSRSPHRSGRWLVVPGVARSATKVAAVVVLCVLPPLTLLTPGQSFEATMVFSPSATGSSLRTSNSLRGIADGPCARHGRGRGTAVH